MLTWMDGQTKLIVALHNFAKVPGTRSPFSVRVKREQTDLVILSTHFDFISFTRTNPKKNVVTFNSSTCFYETVQV